MGIDQRLRHASGARCVYNKQRLRLGFWPRLAKCEVIVLGIQEIGYVRNFNDMKVDMISNSGDSWRSTVR